MVGLGCSCVVRLLGRFTGLLSCCCFLLLGCWAVPVGLCQGCSAWWCLTVGLSGLIDCWVLLVLLGGCSWVVGLLGCRTTGPNPTTNLAPSSASRTPTAQQPNSKKQQQPNNPVAQQPKNSLTQPQALLPAALVEPNSQTTLAAQQPSSPTTQWPNNPRLIPSSRSGTQQSNPTKSNNPERAKQVSKTIPKNPTNSPAVQQPNSKVKNPTNSPTASSPTPPAPRSALAAQALNPKP